MASGGGRGGTTMHSHMEQHRRTHAEKVRKGIISFLSVSLGIGAAESLGGKRWQVICTDERGRKTVRGLVCRFGVWLYQSK